MDLQVDLNWQNEVFIFIFIFDYNFMFVLFLQIGETVTHFALRQNNLVAASKLLLNNAWSTRLDQVSLFCVFVILK